MNAGCEFYEYDKEKKRMVNCWKPAFGKVRGHSLCKEHFDYAESLEGTGKVKSRQDF